MLLIVVKSSHFSLRIRELDLFDPVIANYKIIVSLSLENFPFLLKDKWRQNLNSCTESENIFPSCVRIMMFH